MQDVKRQSGGDPRKCLFKGKSEHDRLRRCVQDPEQDPVQCTECRIDDARKFVRQIPRQQHRCTPEHRPDVQIRYPPHVEAREQTVQKDVDIDRDQCFSAVDDRVDDGQHAEHMDVWQDLQNDLGAEHQRAEHGEDDHFPDLAGT